MRARYLCILLTMSQVSAALSGELGTYHVFPGADVLAPPLEQSTPRDDPFEYWDRMGVGPPPEKPKSAPTPAPTRPQPTSRMYLEAQKKFTFFQRASRKIDYLLAAIAVLFPAQRAVIGTTIAVYNLFKSGDEKKARSEVLKLVDTYCKGCNITQVRDRLLYDQRRVNGIVARGELGLENLFDVGVPPDLQRLMDGINSYTVVNNCGRKVTYAMMYLDVDGSWKTSRFSELNAGYRHVQDIFSSNVYYAMVAFDNDDQAVVGFRGRVDFGLVNGTVDGEPFGFKQSEASRDDLGDWIIRICD